MSERYCWSANGEAFFGDYASREEAARYGPEEYGGPDPGFTAIVVEPPVAAWAARRAEVFAEGMADAAYDEVGDFAEGWMSGLTDDEAASLGRHLSMAFRLWMKSTGREPGFHCVADEEDVRRG